MSFEQTEWLNNRLLLYRLLSTVYREGVSPKIVELFIDADFMATLAGEVDTSAWRDVCSKLQQEVGQHQEDFKFYCKALQVEHMRLFVGPDHLEAPPWESVYLTREKLLCGEPTQQVKAFYHSFGMVCDTEEHELADHIGVELSFMSELCAQAMGKIDQALPTDDELLGQKKFLQEHLLMWAQHFLADVKAKTRMPFFAYFAALTLDWLQADLQVLAKKTKE